MTTALTLKDLPPPPPNKSGWPWTTNNKLLSKKLLNESKLPRLSIVTPSYNQGKFLEATIRSVLLQGYPNLEYLIIDGGSTDDSVDIIKKYEKYLFYWHSQKDQGQADAINQGLKQSSGEILGWINSDDVYVKGTFYKIVKAFNNNPDYIVVHGNRILINELGNVTGWLRIPPFDPETLVYNVCSETSFWQRSAMEQAGIIDDRLQFAIDLEFFGRLYKCGKFLKLDEYLGYFRCYPENKSSTISHIGQEEAKRAWRKLFDLDNLNFQQPEKVDLLSCLKLKLEIIQKPILLGFPYLYYLFSKFTSN
jgi:glycosyltransferase involved in cell wall biosynthesis